MTKKEIEAILNQKPKRFEIIGMFGTLIAYLTLIMIVLGVAAIIKWLLIWLL